MSKKNIETMIPKALVLVENTFVNSGKVESKYFSAVANFGVSVLQSGKHATKLFYEAKKDERDKIPTLVVDLVKEVREVAKSFEKLDKKDILDASTALKLAIRTFKKADNKDEGETQTDDRGESHE